MYEITDYSDNENSLELAVQTGTLPKMEASYHDLPSEYMYPRQTGDNVASSSGSNLRSSFIGMGFPPALVDKAIEENGDDNVDLLLENLFAYSVTDNQKSKFESSDSVDGLFSDKDELPADMHPEEALQKSVPESSDSLEILFGDEKDISSYSSLATDIHPKEEPTALGGVDDDKKASLLMMNFSLDEVEFALDKLGEDALIDEVVDFIFAARMAENLEKDVDGRSLDEEIDEDCNTESMFGTMDKTLRLLEMGFSEQEISAAVEKYGSEVPISQLAHSIFVDKTASSCGPNKYSSSPFGANSSKTGSQHRDLGSGIEYGINHHYFDPVKEETEEYGSSALSHFRDIGVNEKYKGKQPKEEYIDDPSSLRMPKVEYGDDSGSLLGLGWLEKRKGNSMFASSQMTVSHRKIHRKAGQPDVFVLPKLSKPNSCHTVDRMVAKSPYFFYGNVLNLSHDSWVKISQFLYAIEPEFVNTRFFSALSRKEGYIHNLPIENRFHILPKPPMTIEEAVPHTKKYWPSWDTRKQLSSISSETNGISQLCDRLGRILINSMGFLSVEQQRDLLHQCRTLNLLWVGHNKLAPIEPEQLELILGYPLNHTRAAGFGQAERLQSLRHCFQTDTLGYHLSVLKHLFPGGLTVLSIYSGVGGAEITLHRLGIHLKAVLSIEPCETNRKILKQWWNDTLQSGELVQIENIQRLATNKLETLMKKFGDFDFVICQNPYTYSSTCPNTPADGRSLTGLDFSQFYEFVRVLQRVRTTAERNR